MLRAPGGADGAMPAMSGKGRMAGHARHRFYPVSADRPRLSEREAGRRAAGTPPPACSFTPMSAPASATRDARSALPSASNCGRVGDCAGIWAEAYPRPCAHSQRATIYPDAVSPTA
jgi:hypothetical protein